MLLKNFCMPSCMMPDGAAPCDTYQELWQKAVEMERVIQMCFEDSCSPTGKLKKKTVIEIMKHADTRS